MLILNGKLRFRGFLNSTALQYHSQYRTFFNQLFLVSFFLMLFRLRWHSRVEVYRRLNLCATVFLNLYDEHGVSSAWPTAKTHTHARTPRIYKMSVVIKTKLTLSAASLGTEASTCASLFLFTCTHGHTRAHAHTHTRTHARVQTHTIAHAHTHEQTHTHALTKNINIIFITSSIYVRHVANQIDVCDLISLCTIRAFAFCTAQLLCC